jgi:hypothetical protein
MLKAMVGERECVKYVMRPGVSEGERTVMYGEVALN